MHIYSPVLTGTNLYSMTVCFLSMNVSQTSPRNNKNKNDYMLFETELNILAM